jgi:hypothetical protein
MPSQLRKGAATCITCGLFGRERLDELSQLWNLAANQTSFVGPRLCRPNAEFQPPFMSSARGTEVQISIDRYDDDTQTTVFRARLGSDLIANTVSIMSEQKKRIVGAVTHVDEITLQLCCDSLRSQTVQLDEIKVVSGVTPAFTAFNECLDWAVDQQADILIHSAADCIATNDAVQHLVKNMGPSTYVVTGRGFDMINGEDAPVGIWALNIALIRDRFRFRDAFKMDLDFCDRIEAETNWTRGKTKRGKPIGYHHPIWLPREMYLKFRYNAQKYRGKELRKYIDFFDQCLAKNPTNKTLQIGLMGLKRGASEVHGIGAPNREAFAEEWNDVGDLIPAGDDEFFAYHAEFIEIAKEIIPSNLDVQPMAVTSITGLTANKSSLCKAAKQSDSNLSLRLRMELYANRIFRQGKSVGKELLRPIYDVMPEGLKQRYRSTRGHPPATVRERIANVPMAPREFSHGSIAEGRLDWERRWRSAHKSQRVLIVAPKDFAGSMYKWTEALNRHTTYAARLITFEEHQYGYPLDLVVPECDDARFQNVMSLADEAGTFHLKDEHSWFLGGERFANQRLLQALFFDSEFETVPKVFTKCLHIMVGTLANLRAIQTTSLLFLASQTVSR